MQHANPSPTTPPSWLQKIVSTAHGSQVVTRTAADYEVEVVRCLEAALADRRLSADATAVVYRTLHAWAAGADAAPALLHDEADRVARLVALRAGLVAELVRCTPAGGPPLVALLGRHQPGTLALVLEHATEPARVPAAAPPAPAAPPSLGAFESAADAMAAAAGDDRAYADNLEEVVFPEAGVTLRLCQPVAVRADGTWANGAGPSLAVRYPAKGRVMTSATHRIAVPAWRACAALFAGLFVVDRMGLPPARSEYLRRCLREALQYLLGGGFSPEQVIAGLWTTLYHATEDIGPWWPAEAPPQSLAWVWPSAHAAVLGAIDRFAGLGGQPLAQAPQTGAWVEVLAEDGRAGGARVVSPRGRHRRGDGRRRVGADGDERLPRVWVQPPGGEPESVPLPMVRWPRRALWFA